MINRFFTISLVILFAVQLYGQVGVRTNMYQISNPTWERLANDHAAITGSAMLGTWGYGIGIDYWFRIQDYRVEFLPEFGYNALSTLSLSEETYQWSQYYLKWNTHFYVLDFEEDCDCPTFSKQSPWFKKGFFLMLSIGASYSSYPSISESPGQHNQFEILAGVGGGIDIGINDLITITPLVSWNHWFTPDWPTLSPLEENANLERSATSAVQFGLRLGLRF